LPLELLKMNESHGDNAHGSIDLCALAFFECVLEGADCEQGLFGHQDVETRVHKEGTVDWI
jgi:hypothetical protein